MLLARQYYTESKPQHTNNIAHSCIFIYVDNYLFFQGNRLPTLLLQNTFLPVSVASPLTRPCCEVSDVESGISAIISMAIDSCCGKQRIRGFLQNRACVTSWDSLCFSSQRLLRAQRMNSASARKLRVKQATKNM